MKLCPKCELQKPLSSFPKGKDKNGLYYVCKECKTLHSQSLYKRLDPLERWLRCQVSGCKNRAKQSGIVFSITKPFVKQMFLNQNGKCFYCTKEFDLFGTQRNHRYSPSIDQIRPGKGYTEDNILIACFRCNTIKNDASIEELEKLVSKLREVLTFQESRPSHSFADTMINN